MVEEEISEGEEEESRGVEVETTMEVPPNSLDREEVKNNDLGRRSPWWGRRQEGITITTITNNSDSGY